MKTRPYSGIDPGGWIDRSAHTGSLDSFYRAGPLSLAVPTRLAYGRIYMMGILQG